ncbi:MAG: Npt1/Npt2 family nucleotide transporter [Candidatus Babeliales bacterium]|jgi:AAA family ATP:ADP antiporter
MFNAVLHKLGLSFDLDKQERNKIFWLAVAFFCVIGSYTVLKEMKDVLFAQIVGSKSLYQVKIISMFFLLPATLLYAKLVDYMSRFWLLVFYSMLYGIGGIVIAYLLSDPVIGIANTVSSPDRYFGWFVYLFYEGIVPFVVSVYWSFSNSITKPETAKKGYTLIIAGSKLGGMFSAGIAWMLFAPRLGSFAWSSVFTHQILLIGASILLVLSPAVIYYLLQVSTEKSLHGYEASYDFEKQQEKKGSSETGMFSGLFLILKHPYILGIFGMMFFYELVNVVLGIQRTVILQAGAKDAAAFTGEMFKQRFMMQGVGFLVSFFGTRVLIKRLGERVCLMLIPIVTGCLLAYFMLAYNEQAVLLVFMVLGMLNYAFASPVREALYIPTVKDVRFKSKAWIESFGQRFAKACGSGAIGSIQSVAAVGTPLYLGLFSSFFAGIVFLWIGVAWLLGKKYVSLLKKGEAVGAE